MDPDDIAYRRSVRNMLVVLAAIAISVFAALFFPPLINATHDIFQSSVSSNPAFGFTLHLQVNTTSPSPGGKVLITGWLNSTSASIENITSSNSWGVGPSRLWGRICTIGWPIGLGVMAGHYTQDNYTLGTLFSLPQPLVGCPVQAATPSYFLLEPHSSKALVVFHGTTQSPTWVLQSSFAFGYAPGEGLPEGTGPNYLPSGVYTVILSDEWGDALTSNFRVS